MKKLKLKEKEQVKEQQISELDVKRQKVLLDGEEVENR